MIDVGAGEYSRKHYPQQFISSPCHSCHMCTHISIDTISSFELSRTNGHRRSTGYPISAGAFMAMAKCRQQCQGMCGWRGLLNQFAQLLFLHCHTHNTFPTTLSHQTCPQDHPPLRTTSADAVRHHSEERVQTRGMHVHGGRRTGEEVFTTLACMCAQIQKELLVASPVRAGKQRKAADQRVGATRYTNWIPCGCPEQAR